MDYLTMETLNPKHVRRTTGAMIVGALVSYLLDLLNFREATFVAIWVTVISTVRTLALNPTPYSHLTECIY